MLLFIDPSILEPFDSGRPDSKTLTAIENIANARRMGKHAVLGERGTIRSLASSEHLSDRVRAVYKKIYESLPTQYAYYTFTKLFVKVSSGKHFERITEDGKEVLCVPLVYFEDFELLSRTVLLVENRDDALFYRRLSNAYLKWNGMSKGVYVEFEPRSGGGQTTSNEFKGLQDSADRFCLCVVDSDKVSPFHEFGDTAKAVANVSDSDKIICSYVVLNVRMIENLVPLAVYKEIFKHDVNKVQALRLLEMLVSNSDEALMYFHPKKHLKLNKVLEKEKTKPFRQYWTAFAKKYRKSECGSCIDLERCFNPNNCNCAVTLGFGNAVTSLVEDEYKGTDFSHLVDDNIKQEWLRIGELITFWCLASPKISSAGE